MRLPAVSACARYAILGAICCLLTSVADAGFYTWRDAAGTLHFTDSYGAIPPAYRGTAKGSDQGRGSGAGNGGGHAPQRVVIHFERQDNAIVVQAVLNWNRQVLFHLDTGATCTMITGEDARALGLAPDGRPAVKGYIADGSMVELERVVLPSLAVGGAEVHNLEVVIGKMRLLGMDFLREFHLTVDAGGGQLVLERKRGAPEREDPSIADEKSRARSGLENQIEQMELAIASKRSYIDELTADIREEGEKRARVERALHDAHQRTRFEGSDISADESTRRSIEKYEEAMARLDRYIEMRHNDITIQQKQIEQLQGTIEHYERLMTGM